MGTSNGEGDSKELNDSGLGQDDSISIKMQIPDNRYTGSAELLDLSDDVLLFILKYCSAQDLKALGFSCIRLAALILDRTLWHKVDASTVPMGTKRMWWLMRRGLSSDTTHLMVYGFANSSSGCSDHLSNRSWDEINPGFLDEDNDDFTPCNMASTHRRLPSFGQIARHLATPAAAASTQHADNSDDTVTGDTASPGPSTTMCKPNPCSVCDVLFLNKRLPRDSYPGVTFTLDTILLMQLSAKCQKLHTLELEYCNIDCHKTGLNLFPRTLKRLSLVGTKCYNQCYDKSFLFKVQDYLVELEELDLSCCKWLEPSSMLPLSKIPKLKRLYMRRCPRMTEFVAYASLATRYGFHNLEVIDLRESPVGDSEVSSFGWVRSLIELYASPAPDDLMDSMHVSYGDSELDPWEEDEPDFFKNVLMDSPRDMDVADKRFHRCHGDEDASTPKPGCSSSKKDDDDDDEGPPSKRKKPCYCIIDADINKSSININDSCEAQANAARMMDWCHNYVMATRMAGINRSASSNASLGESNAGISNNPMAESSKSDTGIMNTDEAGTSKDSDNNQVRPNIIVISASENISDSVKTVDSNVEERSSEDSVAEVKSEKSDDVDDKSDVTNVAGTSEPGNDLTFTLNSETLSNIVLCKRSLEKCKNGVDNAEVNKGAGTSKEEKAKGNKESEPKSERRTVKPHVCHGCTNRESANNDNNGGREDNMSPAVFIVPPLNEDSPNVDRIPRNNILYVNIGRRVNNTYRLTIPSDVLNSHGQRVMISPQERVDPTSYVTDSTVYRFGRSDSEPQLDYIRIGPNVPYPNRVIGSRPNRSNLRVLSLIGYRYITNRSLQHLATSAPHLRTLDLRGTSVTQSGVENFRCFRPDCAVIWGEFLDDI